MKKVLLLTYAISPSRGSEFSVGWNYVINMSKSVHLTVLYGVSGQHLGDTEELEEYINENQIDNVRFIPVKPNNKADRLNALNKKGKFTYTFYFAFNEWHKQVYSIAKELIREEKFDLVHYLTPIGYREPGYLWKLDIPYIWGPIGGTQSVPLKLMSLLSFEGKLKLGFRKVVNYLQLRYKRKLIIALKNTDVLIASTTEDRNNFDRIYKSKVEYLPENGITTKIIEKHFPDNPLKNKINIIWVGRIDNGKALIILLQALINLKNKDKISLNIVGDGPLYENLIRFAQQNNLQDIVTWHGKVSRENVFKLFEESDLHIITSLTEANTTVIWEAMTAGVPTISLDHCGMHDTICEKCGVKIPIISYKQVINDFANSIDELIESPEKLNKLSEGILECAQNYTWEKRVIFFNKMYDQAILNHAQREK